MIFLYVSDRLGFMGFFQIMGFIWDLRDFLGSMGIFGIYGAFLRLWGLGFMRFC